MKKMIIAFSLLFCLKNQADAQTTTKSETPPSNITASPRDDANTDFQNKFQDTSKQSKNMKGKGMKHPANTTADDANTDYRNQFQDTTRQNKATQQKAMKHDNMKHDKMKAKMDSSRSMQAPQRK